jgi:hypothetical protein
MKHRPCPYSCPNPTYSNIPRLVVRAINELKIKCSNCSSIFTLEQIDSHQVKCLRAKCACPGCSVLESDIMTVHKVFMCTNIV